MRVEKFLEKLKTHYADRIVHIKKLPKSKSKLHDLAKPLPIEIQHALKQFGVSEFYSHQADAIDQIRDGKNVVIETGTASGKTLCYNVPVLEALLIDRNATALYLFPTKALAQDQLRSLQSLADAHPKLRSDLRIGTYDGDTPKKDRPKIRSRSNVLLSNPDMLNLAILPHHDRWQRFFANLKFVVIDELHTYRGPFGSHVANIIRRLTRICQIYRAEPQFICCSATIANPIELAKTMINHEITKISDDGSPKGDRYFVLWNPPIIDEFNNRGNPNAEAQTLIADLMIAGFRSIVFARTRKSTEIITRYVRDLFDHNRSFMNRIRSYRGGYLPEHRREVERQLFDGDLLAVIATNALELGIDVGGLDACVMVGFPGTIASFWQQAGRAGRRSSASLIFLIAHNGSLVEQYLMRHPEYLFDQTPERAVIEPENPYILARHLRCAAHEKPLTEKDLDHFGPQIFPLAEYLCQTRQLTKTDQRKFYLATDDYPAAEVDLRAVRGQAFKIFDLGNHRTIGNVGGEHALSEIHPEAIYFHDGETYLVKKIDLKNHTAKVKQIDANFYTRSVGREAIDIVEARDLKLWNGHTIEIGKISVVTQTIKFQKVEFYSQRVIETSGLDLPEQTMKTIGMWFTPDLSEEIAGGYANGLEAIKNVLASLLPFYVMAEPQGCRGRVDRNAEGELSIFLFDAYSGGLGYAKIAFDQFDEILRHAVGVISECECSEGCPSCVHPMHAMFDNDHPPDKFIALEILNNL